MIRSYTVNELEQKSGCTRRAISDYIAKGVLAGPSHRGRGARYPQKDLDVLTVLPRMRTLMKKEYSTLKEVSAFLGELSVRDINRLATRMTEDAFVSEVRRLRVRNSLMSLLPYVPPERIESLLSQLTPGQIRGIDAGRYQIGAVMDIESLLHEEGKAHLSAGRQPNMNNGFGSTQDLHAPAAQQNGRQNGAAETSAPETSWSVSWLNGHEEDHGPAAVLEPRDVRSEPEFRRQAADQFADTTTDLEAMERVDETQPELPAVSGKEEMTGADIGDRLAEISQRLQKLESMLDKA